MKCAICGVDFAEPKKFHLHIARKHKTRIEIYYREHFPRFDLLTKEPIKFKSYEFYFSSLFNTRENMVKYLKTHPESRDKAFTHLLKLRKRVKDLKYAPSTVEGRTSILPTPALGKFLGIDFNKVCEELGMQPRYDYRQKLEFEEAGEHFNVLVDTREQRPLDFDCPTFPCKLDFGDYTTRSHYKGVFVERKSLVDLCGTLSQGYDRVQREFDRSVEMESSLVICVEAPVSAFMDLRKQKETRMVKASSEFLAHRVREVCQKYPNIQFLFLNDRSEMVGIIKKLFLMTTPAKTVDLQYYYDTHQLTV